MITVEEASDVAAFASYALAEAPSPAKQATTAQQTDAKATSTAVHSSPSPVSSSPLGISKQTDAPRSGDRIFASPLAKKLIRDSNSDLKHVFDALGGRGSGPNGRIIAADVLKAATITPLTKAAPSVQTAAPSPSPKASQTLTSTPSGPYQDFQLSQASIELASRSVFSKQTVPHYYLSIELDLTNLLQVRESFNSKFADSKKGKDAGVEGLSVQDFLIKAAALAMKQVLFLYLSLSLFSFPDIYSINL